MLKKICCSHLQALFINGKPFHSPQEFSAFILASVYIPPQACMSEALQRLADQITSMEQEHLDSLLIILVDFNRASLSHKLHKYRQCIKYPTGYRNTVTLLKDTVLSPMQLWDTLITHLLPTYSQKLNSQSLCKHL